MTKIKALQVFKDQDGEPGERILNSTINMGGYDVSLGKEYIFYIHNPHHNILVDISDIHSENNKITFHAPTKILPMETVKCSATIRAETEEELEDISDFHEILNIDSKISGAIQYQTVEVVLEGTSRHWGWDHE